MVANKPGECVGGPAALTLHDVCAAAHISYRQLDYWIRVGFLSAEGNGGGSGTSRRFDSAVMCRARLIGELVASGFRPDRAAEIATVVGAEITAIQLTARLRLLVDT